MEMPTETEAPSDFKSCYRMLALVRDHLRTIERQMIFMNRNNHQAVASTDVERVDTIKSIVAAEYHVALRNFSTKTREAKVAWPRQVAMSLCQDFTDLPTGEIGLHFGGRDHGTVLYATEHVLEAYQTDPKERERILKIKALITESLGVE